MPEVRRASLSDLEAIVPLFDAYRQFYRREADTELARRFLQERLNLNQSVIFVANVDSAAQGFTQLYPSFSSAAATRTYILNDLYVAPTARRHGLAKMLLAAVALFAQEQGAARLSLSTELSNTFAQALYQSQGWQLDTTFLHYTLPLKSL